MAKNKGKRRADLLRDRLPPEEVEMPGVRGDPATRMLLRMGEQRARERRRTVAQKKRAVYNRSRKRATYDLPQDVQDAIKTLAGRLKCSASDLVTLALTEWMNEADMARLASLRVETPPDNIRFRGTFDFPPLRRDGEASPPKDEPIAVSSLPLAEPGTNLTEDPGANPEGKKEEKDMWARARSHVR